VGRSLSDEGTPQCGIREPGHSLSRTCGGIVDQASDRLHGPTSIHDYVAVLRRRKWIAIQALVFVPLVALFLSLRQDPLFEAQADVILTRENLVGALTGTSDATVGDTAERFAQTQAQLARAPAIARATLNELMLRGRTVDGFLASTSVSPHADADFLTFRARGESRALAVRLANAYAEEFTSYRRRQDTGAIRAATRRAKARLRELEAAGKRESLLYANLAEKTQQLETIEAIKTPTASLLSPATRARQLQPRPLRSMALGLALGLILGIVLALLRDALDTRFRGADEVSARLRLPLLARLPQPAKKLRKANELVMRVDPHGADAEPYRMLRTNLEFVNLDRAAKTIMLTSAVEQEGKSTTLANLAYAIARGGRRVVLVDLDLRRPFVGCFFDLSDRPGITDVALGRATLAEALVAIPLRTSVRPQAVGRKELESSGGSLRVLPSGSTTPDPGEFVATTAVARILTELREEADVVLIDSPPILHVGDAMTLSDKVEGLIVVVRLNLIRRNLLAELHRLLETAPTEKLGFVLTGAESEETYGYAGYYYRRRGRTAAVPLDEVGHVRKERRAAEKSSL
jgi:polysaccharide biosynthesis transport protein